MHVSHLSVTDFRSYPSAELELDAGVTALVGPNGQGKTNLVEALVYLSTGASHRVSTDAALVRAGAERAVVRARVRRGDRDALVELQINPGRANQARLNRSPVPRAREVLGVLRTVMFAPEDLELVKGDPGARRRFLDELVVQLMPRMAGTLADYDRVLRQRSALLKSAGGLRRGRPSRGSARGTGPSDGADGSSSGPAVPGEGAGEGRSDLRTLDVWDAKLAAAGAQIVAARMRLVHALAPHVAQAYEQVSTGQGAAVIAYRSALFSGTEPVPGGAGGGSAGGGAADVGAALDDGAWDPARPPPEQALLEAQLLEAMARLRSKEIERGVCLVGPHRDELLLRLGGLPAKGYASHGESWSFALALRLASYRLLAGDTGAEGTAGDWDRDGEPVLILDDVFAELDVRRRDRLAELVASAGQVIVTAAVAQDVPELLEGARVDVMAGELTRVR